MTTETITIKTLYKKLIIFAVLLGGILILLDILSFTDASKTVIAKITGSEGFLEDAVGAEQIRGNFATAGTKDGRTAALLGDSVCNQMMRGLQEYNDEVSIVGGNAALTMAGQYLLAKEYLDNHEDATDLYLMVLPESLTINFTPTVYRYMVIPCCESGLINELDDDTLQYMYSVYGKIFMNPKVIKMVDNSGVNRKLYLNTLLNRMYEMPVPEPLSLANVYICKIEEMCRERGVNFYLYPSPVNEVKKEYTEEILELFKQSPMYEKFPYYPELVKYYPEEQFKDSQHFGGDYENREEYDRKLRELLEGEAILEKLKLSDDSSIIY